MLGVDTLSKLLRDFRSSANTNKRKRTEARISGKSESELYPYYGQLDKLGGLTTICLMGELVLLGEDGAPFLDFFERHGISH